MVIKMDKLVPESITLSIYNKEADKFGVTWHTAEYGNPILEYTDPSDSLFANAVRVKGEAGDGMGSVKNTAVFENLEYNKPYLFRVGDESGVFSESAVCRFPDGGKNELTFLVITDTQDHENHGTWMKFLKEDARRMFPEAEFIIHTGDMVQESGDPELWKKMLHNNRDFFLSMPMVYVSGNHDYWKWYLHGFKHTAERHFHIDHPPQDTANGVYYSFEIGPAHFTVLSSGDSMDTDNEGVLKEQFDWAVNDLSQTSKPWKIVCIHNPLYSPGKYGCMPPLDQMALALRRQFNAPFAELGVDLVLCGHDHVYSQTFPIDKTGEPITDYKYEYENDVKIALNPSAPIHLESGCAGNQHRGIESCLTDEERGKLEKISPMNYGYVSYSAIKISGDTLSVCYRKVSVNTGECTEENKFGIKKSS